MAARQFANGFPEVLGLLDESLSVAGRAGLDCREGVVAGRRSLSVAARQGLGQSEPPYGRQALAWIMHVAVLAPDGGALGIEPCTLQSLELTRIILEWDTLRYTNKGRIV